MLIAAQIFATGAALLHLYIFWLESFAWMRPSTRKVFGVASEDEARVTRSMAYNQGFYNAFLAVIALVGVIFLSTGTTAVGAALVCAGAGSMAAAALVLVTTGRAYTSAAIKQGTLPALAVITLIIALV
ncbi:DUF1304 domain-containing protein [Demequina globuliformis]|uniref:DUF1304 domain-containing protein n=1 Tax=Demequina globuliformis TaxID=676202 RepID=UPI0007810CFA|nr:DUF1304 domain-containing protein [Demequina globuliformis]